ncbi:MAG: hypothetical protein GY811_27075 [Myxococcales bacterium]|nr:hypothetical protein [Myxococcales bacterium]
MSSTLKAVVSGGQAVIKDVGDYPDGTVLELSVVEDDGLDEAERAELDAALDKSWDQAQAGKTRPMKDVVVELSARGR